MNSLSSLLPLSAFRLSLGFLGVLMPILAHADLQGEVRAVLMNDLLKRAEVGIEIVRLGANPTATQVLLKHNSDIPLVPASNLKLVTTSAALDFLGADFRFRTVLARHGDDLVLIGDGDPTFGDVELLHKFGWDTTTVFNNWAVGLAKHGLTHFNRVIVDDSVFEAKFQHSPIHTVKEPHQSLVVGGIKATAFNIEFAKASL